MWGIIAIIVVVLIVLYFLLKKKPEKDDGYGGYATATASDDGFWGKVKDACCTRMR